MKQQAYLLLLLCFLMLLNVQSVAVSNKVVAVVNDDVVTENELKIRLNRIKTKPTKAEAQRYDRFGSDDELRYQVLKALVEETVLVQRAKQLGISVSQAEVESTVQTFAKSMGIDTSSESSGLEVDSLRKEVESELLVSRLVRATLTRGINVSAFEIDEVISKQKSDPLGKEFEVLQLFVKIEDGQSKEAEEALQIKFNNWREDLVNGMSMDEVVAANASSTVVPISRNLGWKSSKQLPDLFLAELNTMKRGGVSGVIVSPNAFHILQLVNFRGGAKVVEKRAAQHILIRAETELERQQASEKLVSIRGALLAGGDFSEYASRLSDDAGSAAKGGDLGWLNPGDTVPEFNEILFGLKVGEVSQPVRTVFGVHLIKLNQVEEADVSNQEQRNRIAEQIRRRKTGQQYSAWLSDLMSRAYIDYF